ncbi:MAG TPA: hypothetical protein VJQ82_04280 [Terriglobales bacterium]|nr:hypothetical protein [Terriglobales bacterium]
MARDGAGNYSLPSGNPVVPNTVISSGGWANPTLSDIAAAITQSLSKDGQTTPTANLPMGNFRHTNVANAANRTDYAAAGQVQDSGMQWLTGIAGTDTITASLAVPPVAAYVAGQVFRFIAAGANTGSNVSLNINSLGAKSITKNGTSVLVAGDIPSGAVVTVVYDGAQFQMIGLTAANVSSGPNGTAFSNRNKMVNGSARVTMIPAPTLTTSAQYGQVEGIAGWASSGTISAGTLVQDTAAPIGRTGYACRFSGCTVSSQLSWRYRMEAADAVLFKNQVASFQVKVQHDVGVAINYVMIIRKPTAADNFGATTQIATQTISVPSGTPTTLFFPQNLGDCSNGLEMEIQMVTGSVGTKNFWFTEWQWEDSGTTTPFEYAPYEFELARCQRYALVVPIGSVYGSGYTSVSAAPYGSFGIDFPVEMRAAPSVPSITWTLTQSNTPVQQFANTRSLRFNATSTIAGGSTSAYNSASFTIAARL